MKIVTKPWGHEVIWAHTHAYVGKILHVKKGHSLSLQYHEKKDETIYIHSGKIKLLTYWNAFLGEDNKSEIEMNPGDSFHIEPLLCHRMTALEDTDILEASTPELDDVVRLEDNYGRVK
jgi:mannose-6-phosphate isomerase